jgi:hypothetical protein
MPSKFTNNAFSTLASSINTSAVTISLAAGTGSRFPTLGGGDFFFGTLIDASNNLEIVRVTARSGDTLTVVRGQDGTSARSYAAGDRIELRPVAAAWDTMVQTDNAQTISGAKTFSSTITGSISGTASNVTGTVAVANGGTGATTAAAARTNLGVAADAAANGVMVRTAAGARTARSLAQGTGITITNADGTAGNPTITNAGVTSVAGGTGISVSGSTGAVTITNSGVTSVNGQTGAVTVSSEPTTAQVLNATAGAAWGAVGTYALRHLQNTSPATPWAGGSTASGADVGGMSGTWRAMHAARLVVTSSGDGFTNYIWLGVYLRIS